MDAVKVSGECKCLGWCGKTFHSPDKTKIRFCPKCRGRRTGIFESISRVETRSLGGSVKGLSYQVGED